MGCCFSVGYGAMNVEVGHRRIGDHNDNDMIAETECATTQLVGGAIMFEAKMSCEDRFSSGIISSVHDLLNTCYKKISVG